MVRSIQLTNYRGFEDTKFSLRQFCLLIGKNSSGKSTFIEALRLLSLITQRATNKGQFFTNAPEWTALDPGVIGFQISLSDSEIDLRAITNHHSDEPAVIRANYEDGSIITGYVRPQESLFATIQIQNSSYATKREHLKHISLMPIFVMPQVAPLQREERIRQVTYIKSNLYNPISRLHFRNQIFHMPEHMESFKIRAEESWPGLQIREFQESLGSLNLIVRERDFSGEIGSLGSGPQVWLQMIWFLSRISGDALIALDEPDVYLHADLQRKLVSVLKDLPGQVIVASHSVEIMAECKPREMLIVDRAKSLAKFADSNTAVQRIINELGGIHNIQLARLWGARRCLFVEGKDMEILRAIARSSNKKAYSKFTTMPNFTTGGWSGLPSALGFSSAFSKFNEGDFQSFCILDRDFRSNEAVSKQIALAEGNQLKLFVWERKEIENYLLVPEALARTINLRAKATQKLSADQIREWLLAFVNQLKNETFDSFSHEFHNESSESRGAGTTKSNQRARQLVEEAFQTLDGALTIVCGKEIFRLLNQKLSKEVGLAIGTVEVAREMRVSEVSTEMRTVLDAICT